MALKIGSTFEGGVVTMARQSDFFTHAPPSGATNGYVSLPLLDDAFEYDLDHADPIPLNSLMSPDNLEFFSKSWSKGTLKTLVHDVNMLPLFRRLMGTLVTTGSADPWTHTLTPRTTLVDPLLLPPLTMWVSKGNIKVNSVFGTVVQSVEEEIAFRFESVKPDSLELAYAFGQPLEATWGLEASIKNRVSASVVNSLPIRVLPGSTSSIFKAFNDVSTPTAQAVLTVVATGGTGVKNGVTSFNLKLKDCRIRINNNLNNAESFRLNMVDVAVEPDRGKPMEVTFEGTMDWSEEANAWYLESQKTNTSPDANGLGTLTISSQHSITGGPTRLFQVYFDKLRLSNPRVVPDGNGRYEMRITARAKIAASDSDSVKIVMQTGEDGTGLI